MMFSQSEVILPQMDLQRSPPVNLVAKDINLFRNDMNKLLPQVRLLHYKDVNVTPESIVWKNVSIANELLIYPDHQLTYTWKYTISNRIKRRRVNLIDDNYILCTDYWGDGYFHWVCDSLPRLMLVKDRLPSGVLLMPAQYTAPYYAETLQAFEIGAIKQIPLKNYFHLPRLLTPEQPTISGEMRPDLTCALRSHLLKHFQQFFSGKLNKPNIYVSRNKAKYRKVLNEEDLLPILKKYGFEVVFFEDFTMREQIEIAFNARNFISLHGANLTNVMYMQSGGNVFELRKNNDLMNNYYYSLADSVRCNYFYQNCEYFDRKVGNFFDVIVDVDLFEKNIRQMLFDNSKVTSGTGFKQL